MGWISVKDRLPERSGKYICVINSFVRDDYISICDFYAHLPDKSGGRGWYKYSKGDYWKIGGVKYWMPLPGLPEE